LCGQARSCSADWLQTVLCNLVGEFAPYTFTKGAIIFSEGDLPDAWLFVGRGEVRTFSYEQAPALKNIEEEEGKPAGGRIASSTAPLPAGSRTSPPAEAGAGKDT
jgi:hypothetical protein